ncbi:hypothetical protein GYA28_02335 [Candidatus Roizmanbacteria bacterium]|jgi:uncharacterized membrane protein YdjX (TVP38/TMEM64 family)|nr:hypothetical protein [Candidatus Roizmanbacteria bacterium]
MIKLYLFSKKIHRVLVMAVVFLGSIMGITGLILKYHLSDYGLIRWLHNQLSLFFGLVFFVMLVTGIVMYIFPLTKRG